MPRSVSRESFLARMAALESASQTDALQAHAPVPADNDPSRLLRNGLTVVGFAAFEDFFISRTKELLERIDPVKVPFDKLPAKLQAATTWGAVQTLVFRARLEKDPLLRLELIQDHATHVASTSSTNYRLSPLSFAPQGSNLSEDDIDGALKALMVDAPWIQLGQLASRVGYGVLGLGEVFRSSAGNRHLAAHLAAADMSLGDVQDLATRLRVVGLAVEVLMTQAITELPAAIVAKQAKLTNLASRVKFRFIDGSEGRFKALKEDGKRADRVFDDVDSAIAYSLLITERAGSTLVVRDHRGWPVSWYSP